MLQLGDFVGTLEQFIMKTAILLLVIGLIIGLAVPYYLRDIYAGAGVQLPQFFWTKSPPRSFSFNGLMFFRIIGVIFVTLAIGWFVFIQNSSGK